MQRFFLWLVETILTRYGLDFTRYCERTDASSHAKYYHGRERPLLQDVAEALYARWGFPAQDQPLDTFQPADFAPIFRDLAEDALKENKFPAEQKDVDRLLRAWYDVGLEQNHVTGMTVVLPRADIKTNR
jgi:hypothetical protein